MVERGVIRVFVLRGKEWPEQAEDYGWCMRFDPEPMRPGGFLLLFWRMPRIQCVW